MNLESWDWLVGNESVRNSKADTKFKLENPQASSTVPNNIESSGDSVNEIGIENGPPKAGQTHLRYKTISNLNIRMSLIACLFIFFDS